MELTHQTGNERTNEGGDRPKTESPTVYTPAEMAEILKINIRYVRENARTRKWPSLSFGERTIRFSEQHLQTILSLSESPAPLPTSLRRRTRRAAR